MMRSISATLFALTIAFSCASQKEDALAPKDFKAKMSAKVTVLDVRTVEEYKSGHLENAVNININDTGFEAKSGQLDKSKPVLVYCLAGSRSRKAAQLLRKKGFQVLELKGGISAWQEEGLPVVK